MSRTFVNVNGVRHWTLRHGSGPPLALLHGGPGMWDYFDAFAPMIDDLVEVHRYDQRGGGRSDDGPPYDISSFVADLDALRAHWGHERWTVAGHSWGASLALAYAVEHPERVAALICMSGLGVAVDDWRDEYHANADARRTPEQRARRLELKRLIETRAERDPEIDREYCILTWMADYADPMRGPDQAAALLGPSPPNYGLNAALNAALDRLHAEGFEERVRRLDVPALVLHGTEDPRPVRLAERLASTLPDARLVTIEGAGHLPWVERPDETRETVREFLEETLRDRESSV